MQSASYREVEKKSAIPLMPRLPSPKSSPRRVWICGSVKMSSTPWMSTTISLPPDAAYEKREKQCGVARCSSPIWTKPEFVLCLMYVPLSIARSTQ